MPIFVASLVGVLATDLLIGIGVKLLIHVINGVPVWALFKPYLDVEVKGNDTAVIHVQYSAVFSNWLLFRRQIIRLGLVETSECRAGFHTMQTGGPQRHGKGSRVGKRSCGCRPFIWKVTGMEGHKPLSHHDFATRKRAMTRLRRVTVVAGSELQTQLIDKLVELGASGYTTMPCSGAGRNVRKDNRYQTETSS